MATPRKAAKNSTSTTVKEPAVSPAAGDPNKDNSNRTWEVVYRPFADSETVHEYTYRIRCAHGGLEDNLMTFESEPVYLGMISEKQGQKWSPYGWGHLPAPAFSAREVFPAMDKPAKEANEPVPPTTE